MGWGMGAAEKRQFMLTACSAHKAPSVFYKIKTLVVDANAVMRKLTSRLFPDGNGDLPSVEMLIFIFWKQQIAAVPNAERIIICFDRSELNNDIRRYFHANVRYATTSAEPKAGEVKIDGRIYKKGEEPASDGEVDSLDPERPPPCDYNRIFSSARGKPLLWQMMEETLKRVIQKRANGQIFVIESSNGRWYWPAEAEQFDTVGRHNFGEADSMALEWARAFRFEGPTMISTIDWDQAVAMLTSDTGPVEGHEHGIMLRLGNVYGGKEDIECEVDPTYYSAPRAKKMLVGKPFVLTEIIDCAKLMARFPETEAISARAHRLNAAVFCLIGGGCDYNDGLAGFGISVKTVLGLCGQLGTSKFIVEARNADEPLRRALKLKTNRLLNFLRPHRHKRHDSKPASVFSIELTRIAFCIAYFIGFDAQAPRGGPDFQAVVRSDLFGPSIDTVGEAWLSQSVPDIVIFEQHPDTEPRYNRAGSEY